MSDQVCVDCDVPVDPGTQIAATEPPAPSQHVQVPIKTTEDASSATISPPSPKEPSVIIEYCDRVCRRQHRATWTQTELLLTFPTPAIQSITIIPLNDEDTGGRFRVWLINAGQTYLMWDRKTEGGFPELKALKQRIRDQLQPGKSLGHSDVKH
ncbi:hypothetical protein SISSUDRAFT_1053850 [Sistotremastrum suecicum HHB10207 ss-3]|uniref:Rdx family-domain-containing protein n=1 Tax=Sistotremastrum suecicum HHB10207 ss-3 TaxID=1314776 RepID=A0A165YY17_9AGAM|nr:hypothetical protein SISSUDRAFT_1053850 [Sistotremastrum suecicum HHB10207 ss-3]